MAWREGTNQTLRLRFARVRVHVAHLNNRRLCEHDEQWLLIEWPKGQSEPTRYWLSNLPPDINLKDLVNTAKMRWRIEHDYHELKQGSKKTLLDYKCLPYPKVTSLAAVGRTQRHVPDSIPTLRYLVATALAKRATTVFLL